MNYSIDPEAIYNARLQSWREEVAKAIRELARQLNRTDPITLQGVDLGLIQRITDEEGD